VVKRELHEQEAGGVDLSTAHEELADHRLAARRRYVDDGETPAAYAAGLEQENREAA
jgi:hypothetical protein